MSGLYKKKLVRDIEEHIEDERKQEALHVKYHEDDKNVRIVEKNNVGKFIVRVIGVCIRVLASVAIVVLAAIGIIALIYPQTRTALMTVKDQLMEQLQAFLPFL